MLQLPRLPIVCLVTALVVAALTSVSTAQDTDAPAGANAPKTADAPAPPAPTVAPPIVDEPAKAEIDTGDTAWMIVATGLVLFMTPGLAFFYGGLVRRKNVLSVLMQCFMCMSLMTVIWILFGYSLAFGGDGGFIGNMDYAFMKGVGQEPKEGQTIPHVLFMMFQGMFAIITPALILGAFAERMKFAGFCVFSALWLIICYCPVCHWVWGGGSGFWGLGEDGARGRPAGVEPDHQLDAAGDGLPAG